MANSGASDEIANIIVAVELLRQVFVELKELALDNSRLHFAMRDRHYAIGQRLDLLSGIADSLKAAVIPLQIRELSRRAKALIVQLASELEPLAREVDAEFELKKPRVARQRNVLEPRHIIGFYGMRRWLIGFTFR
jgi:hypothetical protein